MTRTVVGHPRIITENFDDVSTYFGLVKCTVLPPQGLFHPGLPYCTQGKLMFPLCKACADTRPPTPTPTAKEPCKGRGATMVQRRTGESIGERLPNPETARSMAFS